MPEAHLIPVWQAAILGALQGLTEFLPISSSAHLRLVPWIFNWTPPANEMAFDVALHVGTVLAIIIFFFFDWLLIVAHYIGDLRQKRFLGGPRGSLLPKVVLGTIPAVIVGLLFEKKLEAVFYSSPDYIWVLATTLAVFGLLLFIGERIGKQTREITDVTYLHALIIGSAQAIALVPGVSRSGVTILVALLLSLKRPAAARFSFLLATPITTGAALMKVGDLNASDYNMSLFVGTITSAVVGMVAIMWLLKFVQTRRYTIFVVYRWLLAAVVLTLFFMRREQPIPFKTGASPDDPQTTSALVTRGPGQ